MNYEALVPSRELCEELARLGICQDGAELWWIEQPFPRLWEVSPYEHMPSDDIPPLIAPTLNRMMNQLPDFVAVYAWEGYWIIADCNGTSDVHKIISQDKQLPNAVARALIAFKEAK